MNNGVANQILNSDPYSVSQRLGNAINDGGDGTYVSTPTVQNPLVRYTSYATSAPYATHLAARILPSADIGLSASSTVRMKVDAPGGYFPINFASITNDGKTYQFADGNKGCKSRGK